MGTVFKKANLRTFSLKNKSLSGAHMHIHMYVSTLCSINCVCLFFVFFFWRLCSRESLCSILDSGNHHRNLSGGTDRFQTLQAWLLVWGKKLIYLLWDNLAQSAIENFRHQQLNRICSQVNRSTCFLLKTMLHSDSL